MSWTLIEHQALSSSAASVTLGSGGTIPQTYKTLKLVLSTRTDVVTTVHDQIIKWNNSGSSFSGRRLYGSGTAAASYSTTTAGYYGGLTEGTQYTASTFASTEVTIPNYSSTTANKASSTDTVTENNGTASGMQLEANLWSSTAAITSIVISPDTGNFVSGSTFTLYGLA